MVDHHLGRSRSQDGAPLRRLDLDLLREVLSALLRAGDDDAFVVYQLTIACVDPAAFSQERGLNQFELAETLREAVDALADAYEDQANEHVSAGTDDRVAVAKAVASSAVGAGLRVPV